MLFCLTFGTWQNRGKAVVSEVEKPAGKRRASGGNHETHFHRTAEQNLSFRLNEDDFTIKFIVAWRRGGPGYKSPWARVDVYSRDGMPQFSVDREGRAFTRRRGPLRQRNREAASESVAEADSEPP